MKQAQKNPQRKGKTSEDRGVLECVVLRREGRRFLITFEYIDSSRGRAKPLLVELS